MNIRKFQPADLEAILELFHHVVHTIGAKYYNSEQVQAWAPSNADKEKWLKSLTAHITYVAEDQGKLIGFGDMSHTGYIDRLYVHKNYQGKGVALALLKKTGGRSQKARYCGIDNRSQCHGNAYC